jgi:Protein of unknown function (DUF1553)/Protein of unknown function (DUF1549)
MKRLAGWLSLLFIAVEASTAWGQSQAWRSKEEVVALAKRIDDYIAAAQKAAGVTPVPPAGHGSFFRRLHIDLVGRIPEYTDSRGYIEDGDPDKLWDRSGRFLEDKSYGKHFAAVLRSHILNAANQQAQPFLPPFELWLKEQLEKDVGYDRIVGNLLKPGSESFGNMMPFRGGGMQNVPGSPAAFYIAAESKAENLAGSASRVFLGVKLECAQCHAHPFAKWTREEFWEFAAFFSGTQQAFNQFQPNGVVQQPPASTSRQITIPGTNKVVKAKFLTGEEPKWKENEPTRQVLANWITTPKNPYFAKATADMIWQYFFGVSLLEPIMEPSDDSPITHPQLLDELAQQLVEHNFDLKYLIRAIVLTQAYQRSSGNEGQVTRDDYVLYTRMPVRGMSPEQLYDSVIEAAIGPKGHSDSNYQPDYNFGPRMGNNDRAVFLAKFANQDKRHESHTSILQALFLMNGKFLADKIKSNENLDIIATKYRTSDERIRTLYLLALSREPRPEERERLARFLEADGGGNVRQRLGDMLWALLNSAEFRLNH